MNAPSAGRVPTHVQGIGPMLGRIAAVTGGHAAITTALRITAGLIRAKRPEPRRGGTGFRRAPPR